MQKKTHIALDALLAGILFLLVLIMFMLSSCKHTPDEIPVPVTTNENGNGGNGGNGGSNQQSTCDPDSVYFQTQVLPLLVSNCAKSGCHTPQDHQDGVVLNNYSNVMATGDVDPGRPGHSEIYEVITENDPDKRMPPPPANPLNAQQIQLISQWIQQGAQNNFCSNSCDTNLVTFSGNVFPLIQSNCVGCHSGSAPGGQILLTDYQNIKVVANNGKLLGAVSWDNGFQPMPRGGSKLQDCQIDQIRIWIQNGSQND